MGAAVMGGWFRTYPAAYREQKDAVQQVFPDLNFFEDGDAVMIKGGFAVLHEGAVIDRFALRVQVPGDFPSAVPTVWEVGGRIPRDETRHVNTQDGSACLFVTDEKVRWLPQGSTLLTFFRGPVHSFFLSQLAYERDGEWPFGQRPHGDAGVLHMYAELMGSTDLMVGRQVMQCLALTRNNKHMDCPCGSGKKQRTCHMESIERLRHQFPHAMVRTSLAKLERGRNVKTATRGGQPARRG